MALEVSLRPKSVEKIVSIACVSCLFYDRPHMALCLLRPVLHHKGRWAFCGAAKYPSHAEWELSGA